ncbi:MAG TPA: nitroreductase family protein [Chryseosolibacter sp.]|nr:nitroreductase family protein [Chryseosolibacter sp.]
METPTIARQKSSEFGSPVLEVIQNRRSRRAYISKEVEPETINTLFEAARWAPSSVNEQPWMYIYAAKDQALWQLIYDALNESNKVWVQHAPLLIASFIRTRFTRNDRTNNSARYDLGAANAFLSLQATHLGLNVHQMGGFDLEKLRTNLNVPSDFDPVVVMAIGYPGEADILPEPLKARELAPRERYVRDSFVMNTIFNEQS